VPYAAIAEEYSIFKTRFEAYNSKNTTYDLLKTNYNEKVTEAKTRSTDPLRSALQAPIIMPERPCKPDVPTQYDGLQV